MWWGAGGTQVWGRTGGTQNVGSQLFAQRLSCTRDDCTRDAHIEGCSHQGMLAQGMLAPRDARTTDACTRARLPGQGQPRCQDQQHGQPPPARPSRLPPAWGNAVVAPVQGSPCPAWPFQGSRSPLGSKGHDLPAGGGHPGLDLTSSCGGSCQAGTHRAIPPQLCLGCAELVVDSRHSPAQMGLNYLKCFSRELALAV